jgi:hypothetical protein
MRGLYPIFVKAIGSSKLHSLCDASFSSIVLRHFQVVNCVIFKSYAGITSAIASEAKQSSGSWIAAEAGGKKARRP